MIKRADSFLRLCSLHVLPCIWSTFYITFLCSNHNFYISITFQTTYRAFWFPFCICMIGTSGNPEPFWVYFRRQGLAPSHGNALSAPIIIQFDHSSYNTSIADSTMHYPHVLIYLMVLKYPHAKPTDVRFACRTCHVIAAIDLLNTRTTSWASLDARFLLPLLK